MNTSVITYRTYKLFGVNYGCRIEFCDVFISDPVLKIINLGNTKVLDNRDILTQIHSWVYENPNITEEKVKDFLQKYRTELNSLGKIKRKLTLSFKKPPIKLMRLENLIPKTKDYTKICVSISDKKEVAAINKKNINLENVFSEPKDGGVSFARNIVDIYQNEIFSDISFCLSYFRKLTKLHSSDPGYYILRFLTHEDKMSIVSAMITAWYSKNP